LRFQCPGCGKAYAISSALAGKKTNCSGCGVKFRILGSGSPASESHSAERSAQPAAAAPPPLPAGLDVYGLDDEPVATATPGGGAPPSQTSLHVDRAESERESAAPLPRRDHYKPLSANKKKQIAQRAAKLDRMKPTSAGVGISFGAVLAVAIVGWRVYRVLNRFERAAARANAAQFAPQDVAIDPHKFLADMDKQVEQMIAQPGTAEARDWLDAAKYPNHGVMEMSTADARMMVAGFYERGAQQVYVIDPTTIGGGVMTAMFAVNLPQDPSQRQQCLAWAAKYEEDGQPSPDQGQKYLVIATD
jgi:hypothetical protein